MFSPEVTLTSNNSAISLISSILAGSNFISLLSKPLLSCLKGLFGFVGVLN